MYKLLNNNLDISENHLKVLSLFTYGYRKDFYVREVNRALKISPRTAQLVLEDLEDKGVLKSTVRGKIKSYVLRKDGFNLYYITLAEAYKAAIFLEKNILVKEVIEKVLPFINGIGLIFGSYAKGDETKESDLDIFLAGSGESKKIREISKTYGIEINLVTYPLEKFKGLIGKDILINEVLENHIAISNIDKFVSLVFESEKRY